MPPPASSSISRQSEKREGTGAGGEPGARADSSGRLDRGGTDAQVKQAEAQLAQADLNLGYTEIRAPSDGFVTQRSVQLAII